jgi:hypothetical protein
MVEAKRGKLLCNALCIRANVGTCSKVSDMSRDSRDFSSTWESLVKKSGKVMMQLDMP